jgi:hypothetical protein
MTEHEEIVAGLAPLFKKAEKEGLWFHEGFHDVSFSPKELRKEQANGKFWWGACNWKLIDPQSLIKDFKKDIRRAEDEIKKIQKRINNQ